MNRQNDRTCLNNVANGSEGQRVRTLSGRVPGESGRGRTVRGSVRLVVFLLSSLSILSLFCVVRRGRMCTYTHTQCENIQYKLNFTFVLTFVCLHVLCT